MDLVNPKEEDSATNEYSSAIVVKEEIEETEETEGEQSSNTVESSTDRPDSDPIWEHSYQRNCTAKKTYQVASSVSATTPVQPYDPNTPIAQYCAQLITKNFTSDQVKCNVCGDIVKLRTRSREIADGAFKHVLLHTVLPNFACRYCKYVSSQKSTMISHMRVHSEHLYMGSSIVDNTRNHSVSILEVFHKCFGAITGVQRNPNNGSITNSRSNQVQSTSTSDDITSAITVKEENMDTDTRPLKQQPVSKKSISPSDALCIKLANAFSQNGQLLCRLCQTWVDVLDRYQNYFFKNAVEHALVHSGTEVYQCYDCSMRSILQEDMDIHVHEMHGQTGSEGYKDRSDVFQKEIIQIVRRCYDRSGGGLSVEKVGAQVKVVEKLIGRSEGKGSRAEIENRIRTNEMDVSSIPEPTALQVLPVLPVPIPVQTEPEAVQPPNEMRKIVSAPRVKCRVSLKFRNTNRGAFKCMKCSMCTKHRKLMMAHVKCCRAKYV